ncbi:MAG TPA: hypothetical protein VFX59_11975 [Polyangiales bacterium]|nr:hypothetical protein [Polyangiales bacterium]
MIAVRSATLPAFVALSLLATPTHAQSSSDDAAGWSTPPSAPAPAPASEPAPPLNPDDAAGWTTPVTAPSSPPDADDAAGWSTSTIASTETSTESAPSSRTYPRFDARFRDRRGVWLRDGDFARNESRIAQARSSLDLSVSYAPSFHVGDTEGSFHAVVGWRGEYDMAYRLQRDSAQRELIDSQAYRFIGQESYLALRIGGFELKGGRLIMPLGTGEVISSLDLLNPRDLRQPALVDNENMRIAVLASRASITTGNHSLEALVVHESYFGLLPPVLGRFSPLRKLLLEDAGSDRTGEFDWHTKHHPDRLDPGGTQAIGHYGFTGSGLDLDLYVGSALDQFGVSRRPAASAFERRDITLEIYHPRFTLIATSGAFTAGSFLLRWELGAQLGRSQLLRRTDSPVLLTEVEKLSQINGLLGLTYFGIPNGVMGVEVMQSGVIDNPERKKDDPRQLLLPVEATNIAYRYAQQLWDERISLELVALVIGVAPFNGAIVRGDVGYKFRDGVSLHLIYAHYQDSDDFGLLYGFGKNDRLDASFLYAFGAP